MTTHAATTGGRKTGRQAAGLALLACLAPALVLAATDALGTRDATRALELECPKCGAPAEIIDRFTVYGVPAPVEHVKVRCVVGHWYTIPTDWFVGAGRGP